MTNRIPRSGRRAALRVLGLGAALAGTVSTPVLAAAAAVADDLQEFKRQIAAAPRRRTFSTMPFMVTARGQWDYEAAEAVLAYRNRALQVWECTELDAPWLNLMREAISGQVYAHGNPGFLAVAAIHGSAHLTLFDQAAWDTHGLSRLAGSTATRNIFVEPKTNTSPADDIQDVAGYYGPDNNNIHTLQERGAVFIACHDSIHAIARKVHQLAGGSGPPADSIAADLTNRLVPGAVLVPSVVAFLVELQRSGFTYAKGG
jgi:intracellular sulfur oxidation DsrE/DsrF family protein